MTRRLVIQAMNVHQGGGLALLLPLLRALPAGQPAVVLVDARAPLPQDLPASLEVRRVAPSLRSRWAAERWLQTAVGGKDLLLCFGNLPPLFRNRGQVAVFVQNRYLIDPVSLAALPRRTRLRLAVERLWLTHRASHAQTFIVQTPTMRRLCEAALPASRQRTQVWPYAECPATLARAAALAKRLDTTFLYPASGDAHKNHRRLVQAWSLLARDGLRPPLRLTYDARGHPDLDAFVQAECRAHGLAITNLGVMPHAQMMAAYREADALVYPSLMESFGLPLIEAASYGLPVVAAELDYVRDILDPVQSFDPLSPTSIARAVKRFLGHAEADLGLMDAHGYMSRLLALPAKVPASETM